MGHIAGGLCEYEDRRNTKDDEQNREYHTDDAQYKACGCHAAVQQSIRQLKDTNRNIKMKLYEKLNFKSCSNVLYRPE